MLGAVIDMARPTTADRQADRAKLVVRSCLWEVPVTAEREDRTKDARGQLRISHADREQAIDVLKAAYVQGRLTKDEFDLRVGQAFVSRTYADLGALTADIPAVVTSARPSGEPGRALNFRTAARVGVVGAIPSMASAATVMTQSGRVVRGSRRRSRRPDRVAGGRVADRAADRPVLGRVPRAAGSCAGTAVGSGGPGPRMPRTGQAATAGQPVSGTR